MAAVCASVSMGFTYIKAPLNTWDARSQGPKLSLLLSQQLCIDTTQDYMNHVLSTFGIIYWTSWPSTSLTFSNLRFRVRVRDYSRPLAQFRVRDWDESWAERLGVSSPRRETREILPCKPAKPPWLPNHPQPVQPLFDIYPPNHPNQTKLPQPRPP